MGENKKQKKIMSSNIRLAIEVSAYFRRAISLLFLRGAGLEVTSVAYLLTDEGDPSIVDGFDLDSPEWDWANSVLMLMRTIYGILEDAESVADDVI